MSIKVKMGISWFQPEQWDQVQVLFEDSDAFGESYEDWCKTTNNAMGQLQAVGAIPVKVDVDLGELAAWCKKRRSPVNVKSCSEFVGELMKANK